MNNVNEKINAGILILHAGTGLWVEEFCGSAGDRQTDDESLALEYETLEQAKSDVVLNWGAGALDCYSFFIKGELK